jgi:hypothetical protein
MNYEKRKLTCLVPPPSSLPLPPSSDHPKKKNLSAMRKKRYFNLDEQNYVKEHVIK